MKKALALVVTVLGLLLPLISSFPQRSDALASQPFKEMPLGTISPQGWLRDQLVTMANGSTGHLDEIHSKIATDNGWLGGKGDGWEETPYWLDGAVPLAFLLEDEALIRKVKRYIDWTLDHQRPSGYFGPITKDEREKQIEITANTCLSGEDWWPKMIMLKVLQQYWEATADERVIPFMRAYFRYQSEAIKTCSLGQWTEWAVSRGADNVMMIQWLFEQVKDHSLLELAAFIDSQSYTWSEWLGNRDWVMNAASNQTDDHWMRRHAVNIGMGLRSPVINFQRTGNQDYLNDLKTGWNDLMLLHGLPMGIFSGDEDLHGNDPTQGIELCSIVESMFSLEKAIAATGDVQYMDALERMAFNVLPAQTTDDYNMKQYFQIANQVQVSRGVFDFSLPFDREMNNVFGLKSGYTCCTSNMHQGWTKFASHLWYATPDGLAALVFAPNELRTNINGRKVTVKEVTDYPFGDKIEFQFLLSEGVEFPFQLRIPSWCREATISVNGQELRSEAGGRIITIKRIWKNNDKLQIYLPMTVMTSNWAKNSRTVERGPLVYALKVGERWEKGFQEREGEYFSVFPTTDWNFGLLENEVNDPEKFRVNQIVLTRPFVWNQEHAPIEIKASGRKIPDWKISNGVAHQPVTDRTGVYKGKIGEEVETLTLIPYGCTKVRIVAFPVVPSQRK